MKPERWRVLNALDELEEVYRVLLGQGCADWEEVLIRMRRALAILHAHHKETA